MIQKNTLLFVLCITFFSCNTEPVDNTDELTNDSTLLKKTIETYALDEIITTIYTYDGNKLTNIISDNGFKNTFIYENNRLTKIDHFLGGKYEGYVTVEYNSDEKVASYTQFLFDIGGLKLAYKYIPTHNNDGTITVKGYRGDFDSQTELTYNSTITYEGKNMIKDKSDNIEYSFTYDNKNGIYKNIYAIEVLNLVNYAEFGHFFHGNTNNATSYKEDAYGFINTDAYEYTYNDNDYPKTAKYEYISNFSGSAVETSTIEYFYE